MKKLGLIAATAAVLALAGCNNGAQEWVDVTTVVYDYTYEVAGDVTVTTGSQSIKYTPVGRGTIKWTDYKANESNRQTYTIDATLSATVDGQKRTMSTPSIYKIGDEYYVKGTDLDVANGNDYIKIDGVDIEADEVEAVFTYNSVYTQKPDENDKSKMVDVVTTVAVNLTFTRL